MSRKDYALIADAIAEVESIVGAGHAPVGPWESTLALVVDALASRLHMDNERFNELRFEAAALPLLSAERGPGFTATPATEIATHAAT